MENNAVRHINVESDFQLVITFQNGGIPSYPWKVDLFTPDTEAYNAYTVGFDGKEYYRCVILDKSSAILLVDKHRLRPGRLCFKFHQAVPNDLFPDKTMDIVIPGCQSVDLWEGPSDEYEISPEMEAVLVSLVKGDPGAPGPQGLPGERGEKGDPGAPGPGVARGGSAGQALVKSSASDYDTAWGDVLRTDVRQALPLRQQSLARENICSVGYLCLEATLGTEADNWPLVPTSTLAEIEAAYTQFRAAPGRYRWSLAINSLSEGNPFVEEAELEPLHRDDGGLELLFTSKRSRKRYALALTIADDAVTDARVEYRMREDQACYLAAGAAFNVKTGYWEYRDLRDITEEQIAYSYAVWIKGCMLDKAYYNDKRLRFTFPCVARPYVENGSSGYAFYEASNLEVALVPTPTRAIIGFVYGCRKLKAIYGANAPNTEEDVIDVGPVAGNFALSAFNYCDSLTFVKLKNIKVNIELQWSASLRTECVAYMIANAANTQAITLTLHPKVYALLSDELKTAAAAKNIALATA